MKNILTIDLEEWYHANYSEGLFDGADRYESRVVANTQILIDLFDAYGAKATFFTLGIVAERFPELIREIRDRGHEIATHGYGHRLVYKQDEFEFEEDLLQSMHWIEKATGEKPVGYRSPSWSVNRDTLWVFPVLKRNGFQYDSSVFPVKTFLYGFPGAPRFPFTVEFGQEELLEFPMSTLEFAKRGIPFSGGFYFRFLPYRLIRAAFLHLNRNGKPAMCYLHPREIDPEQPRLENLNLRDSFIHEYGIRRCKRKLEKLLAHFSFTSVRDYLLTEGSKTVFSKKILADL